MASSRQQKWDWAPHLAKMLELYNSQISIPDIHKALQCEGFEPCQRSVYLKFKSMGYPTDPVGRTRLLETKASANPQSKNEQSNAWSNQLSPGFFTDEQLQSALCALPEDQILGDMANWDSGFKMGNPTSVPALEYPSISNGGNNIGAHSNLTSPGLNQAAGDLARTHTMSPETDLVSSFWSPGESSTSNNLDDVMSIFDQPDLLQDFNMELSGGAYFGIDTESYEQNSALSRDLNCKDSGLWPSENNTGWMPSLSVIEDQTETSSLYNEANESFQRKSGQNSIRSPLQRLGSSGSNSGARNRLRSLFKPKSAASSISSGSKKRYAPSQFTYNTDDSGYATGHTSSLTLDQVRQMNIQSLKEFNGLYRVACHTLHEPQSKAQCKDIATCTYCRYSSIHNLAWSARYLKLEVFLSELKLEGVYDFCALDAAGNSALHYAAAGGAGYQHLKALIDVGVDPYIANTAGELFIYCLRPIEPFTLEPNSDCLKSDDLIKLLKLLRHDRVFDWRDNDGQTIMHALALKITEPELKAKIFEMLVDAGYSSTVPDRFGRTPEDILPLTYDCHGQVIDQKPLKAWQRHSAKHSSDTTSENLSPDEWRLERVKQIKAQDIVLEARYRPSYIDPSTGDNAVHALSRLESTNDILLKLEHFTLKDSATLHNREGNYILLNLEYFIARGIDLNLLNLEGSHPLRSFIRERPGKGKETGATMSKYLDTILGKDLEERLRNKVKVDMKDREGATALHSAAILGRPDSVRSLIEAGACVNARSDNELSVLQATHHALDEAVKHDDHVLVYLVKEVIAHLEHAGAVLDPSSLQERGVRGM
ncbi:ankyrin [Stipitochalara longipes BDJ]|nr:ankyrin [Stipitochalara longipes BDJ]